MGKVEKSMWEKLKFLNEEDAKNGTSNVQMSPHLVRADKVKQGGHITMGVAPETFHDIAIGGRDVHVILLVIDKKAYNKA